MTSRLKILQIIIYSIYSQKGFHVENIHNYMYLTIFILIYIISLPKTTVVWNIGVKKPTVYKVYNE
jgi:hypothetical protein